MNYSELWSSMHDELFQAAWATLRLALGAIAIGVVLGMVLAIVRMGSRGMAARLARVYIEVFRGTPALVQLFLVYFGFVAIGIRFDSYQAAVLGLGMNAAAYFAEIFRAGIEAVPRGQSEAAASIGMTSGAAMRWVVLPQAIRLVLAPSGNVAISLLKDTSVASLIAAPDLMLRAQDLSSQYFMPFEIYVTVGAFYFVLCYPLSQLMRHIERRQPAHG
ncbi:amino acid ABC transporter permease [Caballeronia sp. LZ001]|uniref:amino acid ABC transporter permease n=1 Tax=Caballeronia sp. LZ001 TaxID=3038553 RepID=UPI0028584764|nr:amino acid ABC transporter permease [Caballeronia sp. LZ001]MDR5805730.1 amino acid ABC transporter permease [Caballeronia sp. LZ001]